MLIIEEEQCKVSLSIVDEEESSKNSTVTEQYNAILPKGCKRQKTNQNLMSQEAIGFSDDENDTLNNDAVYIKDVFEDIIEETKEIQLNSKHNNLAFEKSLDACNSSISS